MTLIDTSRFWPRLAVVAALVGVPFLRLILREDYGFWHPEVIVGIFLIVAAAALVAAVASTPLVFDATVLVLTVLVSVNALQIDILPGVRLRWITAGTAISVGAAMLCLKKTFYPLFLIFIAGSFATDLAKAAFERREIPAPTRVAGTTNRHVVHIVLDEMLGLSAMPRDCGECVAASNEFQRVLTSAAFEVYVNAFSNYRSTRDSLSSILNGRLLKRSEEFFSNGNSHLRHNRYFDHFLSQNYAVHAYQSDYLVYSSPEYWSVERDTYLANSLNGMHSIELNWETRMRQLFTIFFQSDGAWWRTWTRFAPERLHPRKLDIGPLAMQGIWPGKILNDYRAATKNTLFFAHLLMPHYPYVYRSDGSLRPAGEWNEHSDLEFSQTEADQYLHRYAAYCEQVRFAARQLDGFLRELRSSGTYDDTTIVIHGDHGSRLRLLSTTHQQHRDELRNAATIKQTDLYDYPGEPEGRDLLNQFATLLAIKPIHATAGAIRMEPGSVLDHLQRTFGFAGQPESPERLNSVYLYNLDGSSRPVSIAQAFATAGSLAGSLEKESTE